MRVCAIWDSESKASFQFTPPICRLINAITANAVIRNFARTRRMVARVVQDPCCGGSTNIKNLNSTFEHGQLQLQTCQCPGIQLPNFHSPTGENCTQSPSGRCTLRSGDRDHGFLAGQLLLPRNISTPYSLQVSPVQHPP